MTSLQISTLQECGDNRLKNIGKPCAGIGVVRAFAQQKLVKLRARFAEGGLSQGCFFTLPKLRGTHHISTATFGLVKAFVSQGGKFFNSLTRDISLRHAKARRE